jgi:hypothetical protein
MLFCVFLVCFGSFALLCNIYFQVHFSYNCLCFSELYIYIHTYIYIYIYTVYTHTHTHIYILLCIGQHFVAGLFSFLCAHVCMCCCRLFTKFWYGTFSASNVCILVRHIQPLKTGVELNYFNANLRENCSQEWR